MRRRLVPTRSAAQRAIVEGRVSVVGSPSHRLRPASRIGSNVLVTVDETATQYVGRGGHKLAAALDAFDIRVEGRTALDIGSSTGGFTDCLLQRDAASVVALDVGTDQLHPTLQDDTRVVRREQTDIRAVSPGDMGGPFDLVVADVSFLSLVPIAPHVAGFGATAADYIMLVKPQFEVGPRGRDRRGVVTDDAVRKAALHAVIAAYADAGLVVVGTIDSPLRGRAGNTEYLVAMRGGGGDDG